MFELFSQGSDYLKLLQLIRFVDDASVANMKISFAVTINTAMKMSLIWLNIYVALRPDFAMLENGNTNGYRFGIIAFLPARGLLYSVEGHVPQLRMGLYGDKSIVGITGLPRKCFCVLLTLYCFLSMTSQNRFEQVA